MRTTISTLLLGLLSANVLASQHLAAGMPPAPEPAPAAGAAAPAPVVSTGSVARAQFTSGILDREPLDNVSSLSNDKTQVYFYTELRNLAGGKVTHRWEYKGQVMAEIPIEVGSARWRAWSNKTFDPLWIGEWKVSVVDSNGATLAVHTLSYGEAPAPAATPSAAPAAQPTTPKQ